MKFIIKTINIKWLNKIVKKIIINIKKNIKNNNKID
jgi:hypothetical protein